LAIPQQYQNDGMAAHQEPRGEEPRGEEPGGEEPGGEEQSAAELTALRDQCTRFLHYHGPVRVADLLATVPADTVPDRYGDGGVVADLEG
jgi:hypothetical protein